MTSKQLNFVHIFWPKYFFNQYLFITQIFFHETSHEWTQKFFLPLNFIAHKRIWTPNSFIKKILLDQMFFFLTIFLKPEFFGPIIPNVTIVYDDEKQDKAHKYIQANMCKSFPWSMIPYVTLAYDDNKQNKAHKYIQANMCKLVNHFHVILIPIYYEPIKGLATTIINYWMNQYSISPLR